LTDYNKFQLWLEYEKIAVHFNELLMQLRLRALAGVSLIVSLAGFFSSKGNGEMNWIVLAFVLFVLVCVWIAIFVIDKFYYQRLLGGAVEAILELEAGTACDPIPINLSTKIRKRATNGSIDSNSMKAVTVFYVLVGVLLLCLLFFSMNQAGVDFTCLCKADVKSTA